MSGCTTQDEPIDDILDDQPEEQEDDEQEDSNQEDEDEDDEQEDENEDDNDNGQYDFKRPTVEIIDIGVSKLSTDTATIDITVAVHNPNPVGGTFNEISYTLYFKDERPLRGSGEYEFLGSSTSEQGIAMETGDNIIHVYFTLDNKAVLQTLIILKTNQKQVWMKIEGLVNLDLKGTYYDISYEEEFLVSLG